MNASVVGSHMPAAATPALCSTELSVRQRGAIRQAMRASVESGDVPGVVAQVWRKGGLCFDAAAGLRDVEHAIPMDGSAIFGIASMSKPVTVALALQLLDECKLRLDDPISHWAPEFADMRVLRRPDGPLDDTIPAARSITVEDLMTHRSGLTYGYMTPPPLGTALLARFGMGIQSALTPDAWLKSLAELPLICAPGERFNYGPSIDVLGVLAARILGTGLRSAMRERLLLPLGMLDTDFWVPPEKRSRMTPFYVSAQPAQFAPSKVEPFTAATPQAYASGGEGLVSTAGDYMRFARMLMHDGRLDNLHGLKAPTAQLMRSNRYTAAQRQYPFLGYPFTQGFGLGVSVIIDATQPGATGNVGSFGWGGAFGGWWQADPEEDMILLWLQECAPAPPVPGAAMPRLPGAEGRQQFCRAVYDAIRA
jgi:CubicO group peptidase (beta-lactamase class C family)